MTMEWSMGDLIWFDPGLGHPLPGEIQEVHRAAQVIIVQAVINGKVNKLFVQWFCDFSNRTLYYY
jgi:myosin XV